MPRRAEVPTAHTATRLLGASYIVLALAQVADAALEVHGLPSLGGAFTPRTTSIMALVIIVAALVSRSLSSTQWQISGLVAVWLFSPALSGRIILDGWWEPTIVDLALAGTGVAVAAALAGPFLVRWTLFACGSLWAASSILLGVFAVTSRSGALGSLLTIDPGDRYTRWLWTLGLDVPAGSINALVGLSHHRQILGMSMAMILVLQVRLLCSTTSASGRLKWFAVALGPILTALALAWSMSRTSIAAAAVALVASTLPVERLKPRAALALVAAGVVMLAVAPLALVLRTENQAQAGTLAWRVEIWSAYLSDYRVWGPSGLGPFAARPMDAGHAHNQALDAIVIGGWLGAISVICFVAVAVIVAVRIARTDGRLALGCLLAAAAIAGFEVLTSPTFRWGLKVDFMVLVAVVASSAAIVTKASEPVGADSAQPTPAAIDPP